MFEATKLAIELERIAAETARLRKRENDMGTHSSPLINVLDDLAKAVQKLAQIQRGF